MDINNTSDKEHISSPLPWDQGDKKEEEIPSESGQTKEETGTREQQQQTDIELTDTDRRDNQQQQSGQCVQSKELQHNRCRFCELESNREFWEFIERQQSIWDRLHDSKERKNKLREDEEEEDYKDDIFIIDFFLTPPIPPMMKRKKRNKKKHMKKKWFKKRKQRRDVTF